MNAFGRGETGRARQGWGGGCIVFGGVCVEWGVSRCTEMEKHQE